MIAVDGSINRLFNRLHTPLNDFAAVFTHAGRGVAGIFGQIVVLRLVGVSHGRGDFNQVPGIAEPDEIFTDTAAVQPGMVGNFAATEGAVCGLVPYFIPDRLAAFAGLLLVNGFSAHGCLLGAGASPV